MKLHFPQVHSVIIAPSYLLLEEEMATHSSIFAWRIPWTEESGGLPSMGLQESRKCLFILLKNEVDTLN